MSKRKPPAFQLYASDFLGDPLVSGMTNEEAGAYIRLLCHAWLVDGIPADHKLLARFLHVSPRKFKSIWEIVGPCWYQDGDKYRQKRQEEVRADLNAHRKARSESGKRGAAKRWGGLVS